MKFHMLLLLFSLSCADSTFSGGNKTAKRESDDLRSPSDPSDLCLAECTQQGAIGAAIKITSQPDTEVRVSEPYEYQVMTNLDGKEKIKYEIIDNPGFLQIGEDGKITFSAGAAKAGEYKVIVKVSLADRPIISDTQEFLITAVEVCEQAKVLGLWLDKDDSGTIKDENYKGQIIAYKGEKNGADNYNYFSDSAHPHVGPAPTGFKSHVFFHDGPDGLAFTFYHNMDEGGSASNNVQWDIDSKGNNKKDSVLLSDDNAELKQVTAKSAFEKSFEARWHYTLNTDGGVIGPFEGESYVISVKISGTGDARDAGFYSSDGSVLTLNEVDKVSSFVIGFKSNQICR